MKTLPCGCSVKTLLILSEHPDLLEEAYKIQTLSTQCDERLQFIMKQVQDIKKETNDKSLKIWERIIKRLNEMQKLPEDIKPGDGSLSFNIEEDSISYRKTCGHTGLIEFLTNLSKKD